MWKEGVLATLPENWRRVRVDPSQNAIELGRKLNPHLDLRFGSAPQEVREDLKTADLVLICDVLEHVEDDVGFFSNIVSSVPPGGQILLTVPGAPNLWTDHDLRHGHCRRYTRDRLETLWNAHPSFEVRLFSPLNWRLYPIVRFVRLASRLRGRIFGPGGFNLFLPPRAVNAFFRSVFFSEHKVLLVKLDQPSLSTRLNGVSWIAAVRKPDPEPGRIRARFALPGEEVDR